MEYAGYSTHDGGFVIGQTSWNEWRGITPVTVTGTMNTEEINCPVINISLTLTGYTLPFNNPNIYLSRQYPESRGIIQDLHNFFVQLVAYDSNNNVVAASNVLNFCTPKGGEYFPLSKYIQAGTYTPDGGVTREQVIQGQFNLTNSTTGLYTFTSQGGTNFDLSLGQNVSYSYLRIKITKVGFSRGNGGYGWSTGTTNLNQYYLGDGYSNWVTAVTNATVLQVNKSDALFPSGEQIASGAIIKKDKLLKSDFTPAEYLIGYTKIFGLYYDVHIESKTVDILTRNNYYGDDYGGGHVIDINESIDRDKEIKITPLTFDKKFYDLKYKEDNKSMFLEQYSDTYSKTYGQQAINTSYEFNNDRKNLLDNIPYQSAVEGLEKSKYYRDLYTRRLSRPIWTIVPWEYTLWTWNSEDENYDSTSKDMPGVSPTHATYWSSMDGYDIFPKLQFRDDSNDPVDSKNVLVFFNGFKGLQNSSGGTIPMWLTDENDYMLEINDMKPCWLYTERETDAYGQTIAKKITQLPVFGRYIKGNNDSIELSWDFGEPLELYNPTLVTQPQSTIYNQYWKTYIEDLYSVNTRVVTAYVHFKTPLSKNSLKQFYFFDNSYWVINKIIDYNPNNAVTKIEFVKVNDTKAYTDSLIIDTNDYLIVNPDSISFNTTLSGISNIQTNLVWGAYIEYETSGGTFNATITFTDFDYLSATTLVTVVADNNITWSASSSENWITPAVQSGSGNGSFEVYIDRNVSENRSGNVVVSGSNGGSYTFTITQSIPYVIISPAETAVTINPGCSGITYYIPVTTNVPYDYGSAGWLGVQREGQMLSYCASSNNTGTTNRETTVWLGFKDERYASIVVTQLPGSEHNYAYFSNQTTALTYTFTSSATIGTYIQQGVTANCQYSMETSGEDWLSAVTSSTGISFTVLSENNTLEDRSATITLTYLNEVLAVATIVQNPEPYVNIPNGYVDYLGGKVILPVTSNTSFGAYVSDTSGLEWDAPWPRQTGATSYSAGTTSITVVAKEYTWYQEGEQPSTTAKTLYYKLSSDSYYTKNCTITQYRNNTTLNGDTKSYYPNINGDVTSVTLDFVVTDIENVNNLNNNTVFSLRINKGDSRWLTPIGGWNYEDRYDYGVIFTGSTSITLTGSTYATVEGTRNQPMGIYREANDLGGRKQMYDITYYQHGPQPANYTISWRDNPVFNYDQFGELTDIVISSITVNWSNLGSYPRFTSGSGYNVRFTLYGWDDDYSMQEGERIASWAWDSHAETPGATGNTVISFNAIKLIPDTQGYKKYELVASLEAKTGQAGLSDEGYIVVYSGSSPSYWYPSRS